ncbi:uncharacterized protein LOC105847758 isoform X1 [Hydra vulgaris]|uniref:uncharacterized protein LOC105847758 isoform X1 n=1 Tax=Hydra vulgaris TaxID=6087 RepID=UPI001F5F15A5|nr:uncharacterized protein LOC105847758 isoform X1 [Hydra vulgaris]
MKNSKSKLLKNYFPKVHETIKMHHYSPTLNSNENCSNSFRKECSKLCHHLSPKKIPVIDRSKTSILKMQIENKKVSLDECKKHFLKLKEENAMLKCIILQLEDNMFVNGSSTLQEFEKISSVLSLNSKKYPFLLFNEQHQFELLNKKLDAVLDKFNSNIKKLQDKIDEERLVCKSLKQFKHVEFDENKQKIENLNNQIQVIQNGNQKEYKSFQDSHEKSYSFIMSRRKLNIDRVRTGFCQLVSSSMSPDMMRMARENVLIKKEIVIHKNETDLLLSDIAMLEQQIHDLH